MQERRQDVGTAEVGPRSGAVHKLGLRAGQVVLELGYDEDVDQDLREAVEDAVEGPVEDEDYDGVVDVVLLWWRAGDGDLTDALMDTLTTLEDGGFVILLTPAGGRSDRVPAHEIQEACLTCSLSASGAVPAGEWAGQRLVGRR